MLFKHSKADEISISLFFSNLIFIFYTIVLMVEISGLSDNDTILLNVNNRLGKLTPYVVLGIYLVAALGIVVAMVKNQLEISLVVINAVLGVMILIVYFGSLLGLFNAFTYMYGTNKMIYVFYFGPAVGSIVIALHYFYTKFYLIYVKKVKLEDKQS
ncbi:MAG: hypothetical protein IJF54_00290 [Clostridia bacterium]|nr:hypothetical protein [Clostridia bacterium]